MDDEQRQAPLAATGEGFQTFAGTIRHGMRVIDADGRVLGMVARVEAGEILFLPTDRAHDDHEFVPVSLVDGIDGDRVLLAPRGDASFGLGAEP